MYTCSLYVPGYMKIEREELSRGKEATAEATVLYSPTEVVPGRTTMAPLGGEVRVAPRTVWISASRKRICLIVGQEVRQVVAD